MAFRRRTSAPVASVATPLAPVPSRLLTQLLEHLEDRDEDLCVLDLGPGTPGSVDFFASLPCRTKLTFVDADAVLEDMQSREAALEEGESLDFTTLLDVWAKALELPLKQDIDLLLLWDHPHKFPLLAIEALSSALQPHIHKGTAGYAFGTLHSDQPMQPYRYSIHDATSVAMRPLENDALPYSHSQQALAENFVCMRIARGTLLREGHLELLLEV